MGLNRLLIKEKLIRKWIW